MAVRCAHNSTRGAHRRHNRNRVRTDQRRRTPREETTMISRRRFSKIAAAAGVAIAAPALSTQSRAQGQPIKIGPSISLTGPLAATKNALVGYQLWRDDIN